MVVLHHMSGSLAGQQSASPKAVIKIGRAADNDVRFDPQQDIKVSSHHCKIEFDGSDYVLVDQGSTNGTLVNGRPVQRHTLSEGDVITFGGAGGPEARFSLDDAMAGAGGGYAAPPPPQMHMASPPVTAARQTAPRGGHKDRAQVAAEAAAKARAAREAVGGASSGQTMFYMAQAIEEVAEEQKTGFRKVVIGLLLFFLLVVGAMGSYIIYQRRQIAGMTNKKSGLDKQIAQLQLQIDLAPDDATRADLLATMELLTGQAQQLNTQLEAKGVTEEKRGEGGDFIDTELRKILKKFEADAYRIPPQFKQRVEKYVAEWKARPDFLRQVYTRKKNYWPMIAQAFAKYGLPEEMAFVGWVESYFDPLACSHVKARGMWQFMTYTGRKYGLRVDAAFDKDCDANGTDDRIKPDKAAVAAADYLSDLLCDFGSDSFMLAIASYNKGEAGMRQILRQHKLWRKKDRDFWHLYYLKLLPEETMEYVPRIIAAAIIGTNPDKFGLN